MGGVGLVYAAEADRHAPPVDGLGREREHMERPERTQVVWERLVNSGLAARCQMVEAQEVTRDEARTCHTAEHCDALDALESAPSRQVGAWYGKESGAMLRGWSKAGSKLMWSSTRLQMRTTTASRMLSIMALLPTRPRALWID